MKFETYMVSWKISNIACVVKVFVLIITSVGVLPVEHARIPLVHVTSTRVLLTVVHLLRRQLASQEVRVDLLVWVNAILLLVHLLLISHHLSLGLIHTWVHSRVHVHGWLLLNLLLTILLGWWLLSWRLIGWWLVFVSFSVHSDLK